MTGYCPHAHRAGSALRAARKTSHFLARSSSAMALAAGSIAARAIICSAWFCTTSRSAPSTS
jgi:hypothetical protein